MVNITNGTLSLVVTSGAFRETYAPNGWTIKNKEVKTAESPLKSNPIIEGKLSNETEEDCSEDDIDQEDEDEDTEDEETEEDEDEDDLSEKPLSEMSFEELHTYAGQLKVNVDGLRSKKEVRQAILDSQE